MNVDLNSRLFERCSAGFSNARRSNISVAVCGFWRRFEPAGRHEVSFSSELCSLSRKQCGSKERAALAHDPQKAFNDMEMCTQSTKLTMSAVAVHNSLLPINVRQTLAGRDCMFKVDSDAESAGREIISSVEERGDKVSE